MSGKTATLYFYKLPVNLMDKNFVIESIETYLAGFTPVTKTNFQYQRFELEKTFKVNMNQEYQLNVASLVKYNYLKITTLDNQETPNTAIYYYFIKSAKQISESTIEFTIVMDVLNTFSFSGSISSKNYTLSKKSLITREHKDRFGTTIRYTDSPLKKKQFPYPPYTEVYAEDPNTSNHYAPSTQMIIDNRTQEVEVTFPIGLGTGVYQTKYNVKIYNSNGTLFKEIDGHNSISIEPYDDEVDFTFTYLDDTTETIELYPNMYMIMTFSRLSNNSTAIDNIKDMFDYCYMKGEATLFRDRKVDYFQEGLGTILFKKDEKTLFDEDGTNQWYVMFASDNAIGDVSVSSVKYVNPVQVRFYSDNGYTLSSTTSHEVILYAYSSLIPKWNNMEEFVNYSQGTPSTAGDKYIKIGGTTYDFHDIFSVTAIRKNNNDVFFNEVRILYRNDSVVTLYKVPSIIFYGINTLRVDMNFNHAEINIGSGEGSYSGSASPFDEVDLTDPRLIKCIAFPYAPAEFLVGNTSFKAIPDGVVFNTDNVLELNIQQSNIFNYTKTFKGVCPQQDLLFDIEEMNATTGQTRNIKYESKLLHSDYHQTKFVYDSFSFSYNLENINIEEYIKNSSDFKDLEVNYICSRNVQSKFMFGFPQYSLIRSVQDYDNVLCIERNNEKALFNNAYINYIRSGGYSYDQKKASSQNAVNGVTTALTIIGATASTIGGIASGNSIMAVAGIGLAVSSATQIVRSVHTAQEQDRSISQKLLQSSMQGTSVQGSEDIDILTAFSGNKAKLVYYELSDIMKNAMWDLFHYCGYATHEQKVPVVNTRLYFNFVQGNVILEDYTFNEDVARRIVEKWSQGVTFFHKVSGSWDLDQQYENFEVSLL